MSLWNVFGRGFDSRRLHHPQKNPKKFLYPSLSHTDEDACGLVHPLAPIPRNLPCFFISFILVRYICCMDKTKMKLQASLNIIFQYGKEKYYESI